ncbi:MAG: hypothetical protein EOO27_08410 [Comamonadaceae bacterium]|nr:MAG: hypothetical protein EOO27_08410 [Comamonadaceae bacterium]
MLLGEEWHQRAQWPSDQFDESDVQWVADNLIRVFELYKETRFQLAFDAAGAAPYVENQRVAIAQMWSGIEAIFGVQQELSYRLGLYLAVLTEDGHVERSAVQAEVKSLYSKRSKAVHGVEMKDHELRDAALGSWRLLARAIIALVDLAEPPPSAARLDRAGLSS